MRRISAIKALTISGFVTLISLFVAFRSGAFRSEGKSGLKWKLDQIGSSKHEIPAHYRGIDLLWKKADSIKYEQDKLRMPGSKTSAWIIDPKEFSDEKYDFSNDLNSIPTASATVKSK